MKKFVFIAYLNDVSKFVISSKISMPGRARRIRWSRAGPRSSRAWRWIPEMSGPSG